MHHAALDGAWPYDRHLDHEIVILPRPEAWQHRHLRSALDLEDADRIGAAQHLVDIGVRRPHVEIQLFAEMRLDQREALAQCRQHAQRQYIDLVDAQHVEIVLVPLDDGPILHRRVLNRHQLVEPVLGQHEAADVLGKVAREAAQGR